MRFTSKSNIANNSPIIRERPRPLTQRERRKGQLPMLLMPFFNSYRKSSLLNSFQVLGGSQDKDVGYSTVYNRTKMWVIQLSTTSQWPVKGVDKLVNCHYGVITQAINTQAPNDIGLEAQTRYFQQANRHANRRHCAN
jgi:hypothetical protein